MLNASFPKMFELNDTQKGFPTIRILGSEVSNRRMSSLIADDALGGALSTLPLAGFPSSIREATRRFIIQKEVSAKDLKSGLKDDIFPQMIRPSRLCQCDDR